MICSDGFLNVVSSSPPCCIASDDVKNWAFVKARGGKKYPIRRRAVLHLKNRIFPMQAN
jgi:hypothetical protein